MTGEGKFFDTLGDGKVTYVPGGAEVDGELQLKETKHEEIFFDCEVIAQGKTVSSGVSNPTGSTGDENLMMLQAGSILEYHILGTQSILKPALADGGLDVSLDATDNDGLEICPGILASNKCVYKVGTDPAFFARLKFAIADVSDTDDCAFGFRKMEAYQANIDDYDEMAALNVISGNITIETILNNGDTAVLDTTDDWADEGVHELKVLVSDAGVVTYELDGRTPTKVAAFTFDDDELVVPFFYFLHAASSSAGIVLKEFECGYQ